MSFTPAKSVFSRVFLIPGGPRPDHEPEYQGCVKAGGPSWDVGTAEDIECPSSDVYGDFEVIGEIQGAKERVTLPLTGRYAANVASRILELVRQRCQVDVHVHFGACTDPTLFNTFTKAIVFSYGRLGNWEADDLGALESGDNASVTETTELSSRDVFEAMPLTFQEKAKAIVANEVLDGVFCSKPSCGDCEEEDAGCDTAYFITKTAAGGSPTTPADVVYTLDGGATWNTSSIDSLPTGSDPSAIACIGDYVVVVSRADNALHYVLKSDLDAVGDETWTRVATGFVAGGEPRDMWSVGNKAFIVGNGGYIYECTDPTTGVTVLSPGDATDHQLNAVHAISEDIAVAVGNNCAVVYTTNGGVTWTLVTPWLVAGIHLYCVWMLDEKVWLIGTSNGYLYYTVDAGASTPVEKGFTGSGTGVVYDIAFSNNHVGYLAHTSTTPLGRILRTYNGGYSWRVMPETAGSLPANDRINAVAACEHDVNLAIGGGLADNGTDGYLVVGSD